MKTSIVLSVSRTKFSAVTYAPDLENRIRRMSELGFDGVEVHLRDPAEVDGDLIKRVTSDCGLGIPALGTGQAYVEDGLSFCDADATVRSAAVQRIKDDIAFAASIGAPIVIIGLIRGKTSAGVEKPQAVEWIRQSLLECLPVAADKGIRIVFEPINRYETDIFNTISEAAEFVRSLTSPNAGVLIDTFHMNIEEVSIYDSIRQARDLIFHVHAVDSNRWAPGCGHLEFDKIVQTLREIGYDGYLSAEILPLPDPDTAAETTIRTLSKVLRDSDPPHPSPERRGGL